MESTPFNSKGFDLVIVLDSGNRLGNDLEYCKVAGCKETKIIVRIPQQISFFEYHASDALNPFEVIRQSYASNILSKIEAGEEGYKAIFIYACPQFINPAVPAYEEALIKGSICADDAAYKLQEQDFQAVLLLYEQKTRQVEYSADGEVRGSITKDGIVHVDEAEKQNRLESLLSVSNFSEL
eukprot:scaffold6489_cov164-Chaetoceros_neogracile.AAC.1